VWGFLDRELKTLGLGQAGGGWKREQRMHSRGGSVLAGVTKGVGDAFLRAAPRDAPESMLSAQRCDEDASPPRLGCFMSSLSLVAWTTEKSFFSSQRSPEF
jgi:hypothetical protein